MTRDLMADLRWRGLIHQTTDEQELDRLLRTPPQVVYAGFDPTADSLHVGHLLGVVMLRRFQQYGHAPIAVVGGATGMIGDPSGKSEERNLLSVEALQHNVEAIKQQMQRLLDFTPGPNAARLVNNFDWMSGFTYLEFLRDVGKNFPVNVMLAKDSVKSRLERSDSGLSYTEFSYMLLQAYDFVHLYDTYQCRIQLGGSDQWGNITAGIDLARRMRSVQLYGATWPLLTKADGSKMGKTESGTVWLSAERTSPYQFYQYWIRQTDEDAAKCLRFLTDLPHEEILALDELRAKQPDQRDSQRRLAEALTRLVHGEAGLKTAELATQIFFGAEIKDLTEQQLTEIFADVPSTEMARSRLESGELTVVEALAEVKLVKSKGEGRRAIEQGGAYINNARVTAVDQKLGAEHLIGGNIIVLRRGKANYALLRFA